jgi:hypothetical protein
MTTISTGDVFRLQCHFPQETKPKFLILVKTKPYEFFIINSSINKFIQNRPHLYACQIDVPFDDHKGFLTHDSIANCSDKIDTSAVITDKHVAFNDLPSHKVGRLASYVIEGIIYSLENDNVTLTGRDRKAIINALQNTVR